MISNIDMAEATRLTRLGKLTEAMAILRGETAGPVDAAPTSGQPYIEMTRIGNDEWHSAVAANASSAPSNGPRGETKPRIDLGQIVGRFRSKAKCASPEGRDRGVPSGASFATFSFGQGADRRNYKLYVPSTYRDMAAALIVMLHGCTQSPDDFAIGTGMNALAEQHGFLVVYPEQSQSANMNRCWNWFNGADQWRGAGEPAIIAGIVRQVTADHHIDPHKVFIAGLSAGGAMAAIIGARYPDIFAAVGIHSGLAVGAAHDMPSAFGAMTQGARTSTLEIAGDTPRTIVFHGDADHTVHARNGEQIIGQVLNGRPWTAEKTAGRSSGGLGYSRTVYSDTSGDCGLEYWVLHGAGHAWSGGDRAGSYTDPRGPGASAEMVRFFMDTKPGQSR